MAALMEAVLYLAQVLIMSGDVEGSRGSYSSSRWRQDSAWFGSSSTKPGATLVRHALACSEIRLKA